MRSSVLFYKEMGLRAVGACPGSPGSSSCPVRCLFLGGSQPGPAQHWGGKDLGAVTVSTGLGLPSCMVCGYGPPKGPGVSKPVTLTPLEA